MNFHPKFTAGLVAGAITGILIAEAKRRGIPIEPDEASNITVLISAGASFWMPSDSGAPDQQLAPVPVPASPAAPPASQPAPLPPAPAPQP